MPPVMKTGDTVRDGEGASWQLGQFLGRGIWGKSWVVRREADDASFILKTSLGPEDFKGEITGADVLYAASREAVLEASRLLGEGRRPYLPRLETRLTLAEGQPAYVIPRLGESLDKQLERGLPLGELVERVVAVARLVHAGGAVHGGIRPSNVFFNERGEVFLSDPAVPAFQRNAHRFLAVSPAAAAWFPPELLEPGWDAPWTSTSDAWALAMLLWTGAMAGGVMPNPPRQGLDKAAQGQLKDRLIDRLKEEDSNPRFHLRFAERVVVLLARALSREPAPSPPFRFPRLDELITRLEEVGALIRPQVSQVGKVLLDRPANKPWFSTDEEIAFTNTVGTSAGVEGPEEIGVGLAVFDLDRDERLKDLDLAYSVDKHPGAYGPVARWRFSFRIRGLGPGRFKVRIAFAIRDSGQPPVTAETDVTVTAAPGWVPKGDVVATSAPLSFPTGESRPAEPPRPEDTAVTQARAERAPIASPDSRRPPPPGLKESPAAVDSNPRTVSTLRPVERPADPTPAGNGVGGGPRPIPPASPPEDSGVRDLPRMGAPQRVPPRIASPGSVPPPPARTPSGPTPVTPVAPAPDPAPAASARAAAVAVEEEPSWRPSPPKDWLEEPLPPATRDVDEEREEDDDLSPEDDASDEPALHTRVLHQLRNDPYVFVMAILFVIVLILLVIFLFLRE